MEAPSVGIVIFVVELDSETWKVLAIERVERDWEPGYNPSAEAFDLEWGKRKATLN
jgi:hypothetical protein